MSSLREKVDRFARIVGGGISGENQPVLAETRRRGNSHCKTPHWSNSLTQFAHRRLCSAHHNQLCSRSANRPKTRNGPHEQFEYSPSLYGLSVDPLAAMIGMCTTSSWNIARSLGRARGLNQYSYDRHFSRKYGKYHLQPIPVCLAQIVLVLVFGLENMETQSTIPKVAVQAIRIASGRIFFSLSASNHHK
ncbi:hypothetical protein BDN72DRAFT_128427 [Pluteus cervinus]|uniref:Uncharacterized protein n=1 Tax=Pluteus cervinus TaxID=181527 RepID=A0ACD3AMD2_9AGAR|nr:hypothetical protein BDN72DRAFT_128427 [Pluteus cervinus]